MSENCCGMCKWHQYDEYGKDYVCVNGESEYCADFTGYNYCCEEFEEREKR